MWGEPGRRREKRGVMKKREGEERQRGRRHGGERTRKEAEMEKKWGQMGKEERRGGGGGEEETRMEEREEKKEMAKERHGRGGEKKREGNDLGISLRPGVLDPLHLLVGHSRKRQNKRGPGSLVGWAGGSAVGEGNPLDVCASRLE